MKIPEVFQRLPSSLEIIRSEATSAELQRAEEIRSRFTFEGWPQPYMVDVCRAFRLLKKKSIYIEVGTRDKGNIAYVSELMDGGTIIDVDIEEFPENSAAIKKYLPANFEFRQIVGDSVSPETVGQVTKILDGRKADMIFCDSSHMFTHTLAEFDSYFPLLKEGGFLMYHDALWEGNTEEKGKFQALAAINQYFPVWIVYMNFPPFRIFPHPSKGDIWGAVAIIQKTSQPPLLT